MELQQKTYSCGPAAVRAALYVFGHNIQEATIRRLAKTTPEGTDEFGIMTALQHYGYKTKEFQTPSVRDAWSMLRKSLSKGRPVILCVDKCSHWVTAVGTIGSRVIIFDPENPPKGRKKYSGLKMYEQAAFCTRWEAYDEGSLFYYGISIY